MHPIFLAPLLISALINRRWAIPFVAVGSALLVFHGEEVFGYSLWISCLGALTGLPFRWGLEELIYEVRHLRNRRIDQRPRP
jgi:hypothetical protein